MFTNLFMHLLTIVGMILLIGIATVIIVLIGSFTYVIVKHVTKSAYQTMHPSKSVIPDRRYLDTLNKYSSTTEDKKDENTESTKEN